jgi:hypothetical protein
MKKLEDFKAKKIELKTIYGGKRMAVTEFEVGTCTVGSGAPEGGNDGTDCEQD